MSFPPSFSAALRTRVLPAVALAVAVWELWMESRIHGGPLLISSWALVVLLVVVVVLHRWESRTHLKRQAEIESNEQRLRFFIDQMPAVLWTVDRNLCFTSSEGAALGDLGLETNSVVGMSLYEYFRTDNPDFLAIASHRRAIGGKAAAFDVDWDGRFFRVNVEPFRDSSGTITGAIGIALDVTEHKKAEDALRESEERFGDLVHNLNAVVWEGDPSSWKFTFVSRRAEDLLGFARQQWLDEENFWHHRIHPEDRQRVTSVRQRAVAAGRDMSSEYRVRNATGDTVWVRETLHADHDGEGRVGRFRGLLVDVTDRKRMEEELLKAQRFELTAELASSIAGDYSRVLGQISDRLARLRRTPKKAKTFGERLDALEASVKRARHLNRQILTFTGDDPLQMESVELPALIEEVLGSGSFEPDFAPRVSLPESLWPLHADHARLHQVIVNVFLNAGGANPDTGELRVEAENATLGRDNTLSLDPGAYVKIRVHNGGGRGAHLEEGDADPSRELSAAGVGLATAYSMVRKHGGLLRVETPESNGGGVTLFLPASAAAASAEWLRMRDVNRRVRGRVLLVAPESIDRQLAERILAHSDFDVETAQCRDGALDRLRRGKEMGFPFDAVIVDTDACDKDVGEILQSIRARDADVRAIATGNFSPDPTLLGLEPSGFAGRIPKPYRIEDFQRELSKAIR
jgi:two-component system cell cycle sensor histidine kinase/response regulator CckA